MMKSKNTYQHVHLKCVLSVLCKQYTRPLPCNIVRDKSVTEEECNFTLQQGSVHQAKWLVLYCAAKHPLPKLVAKSDGNL